jgi:phosphohistidine phosphatase
MRCCGAHADRIPHESWFQLHRETKSMTTLYIVRHAYAGEHGDPRYPDDSLRPLTTEGIKQFRKAVKKLTKRGFAPQAVATSPYVRCRQTAEIICERLEPAVKLVELSALEPGSDLAALVRWSREQQVNSLAWVGHAPDVDNFAARLLGAPAHSIQFRKGAVAELRFDDEVELQAAALRYFLAPAELGCVRASDD